MVIVSNIKTHQESYFHKCYQSGSDSRNVIEENVGYIMPICFYRNKKPLTSKLVVWAFGSTLKLIFDNLMSLSSLMFYGTHYD